MVHLAHPTKRNVFTLSIGGMIDELDESVGSFSQKIENLVLTDNTYVVLKSDNGYRRFDTRNFTQPF
jgi:hypothetical protein